MYDIVYFSPTGNTKYLAEHLALNLGVKPEYLYPLEFIKNESLDAANHLVLMYSIHGFNAPRTVKRFVKNLPVSQGNVSLLSVGCNNIWVNDAVSRDLKKQFVRKGYQIIVDEVIAMPLTFVMDFPKETKETLVADGEKMMVEISQKIKHNVISERTIKFKSKAINLVGKLEDPAARLFGLELHAKKSCISCGICWNNCPEHNIKPNKRINLHLDCLA